MWNLIVPALLFPSFVGILKANIGGTQIEPSEWLIKIHPVQPRIGEPITVHYNPEFSPLGFPHNPKTMWFLIYTNPLDPPNSQKMHKSGDLWQITFTLTDTSTKMILFAFQAEDPLGLRSDLQINDNDGDYWDFLIHDSTDTPVRGAHQARALSYTGFAEKRDQNLDVALEEIENELSLYPDNYFARSLYYTIRLKLDEFSETTRTEIEAEIDAALRDHPNDETVMNFAVGGYQMLGQTQKAQTIQENLIQKNPMGEQAAMNALNETFREEDAETRAQRLETFLSDFPQSRLIEFALANLASTYIQLDSTDRLVAVGDRLLEKSTTPAASGALANIAEVFAEKGNQRDRAIAYIDRSFTIIQSTLPSARPPGTSAEEWEEKLQTAEARYHHILGWIHLQKGETQRALTELKKAAEETLQPDILFRLAEALQKTGDTQEAFLNYARVAAFGGTLSASARTIFQRLWTESQKDPNEIQPFLDDQEAWLKKTYKDKVLAHRSIRPAPDFDLEDITGGWVRLSDQRGSVVLLCFWASWSESSRLFLRDLQQLAQSYGRDVLFLTVATDRDLSAVNRFVKQNRLNLPVLLTQNTDRDYKLQGVPTLFVIDTEGHIHFEHKGYRPDIVDILTIELEDLL